MQSSPLDSIHRARITNHCSGDGAGSIAVGLETRTQDGVYYWDGLKRSGNKERPLVLLQLTLGGWGHFRAQGRWSRVGAGSLFSAVIPSPHRYRLPPASPDWTFFWIMLDHPEFVKRLVKKVRPLNRVWPEAQSQALRVRVEELFVGVCSGRFEDPWEREEALFRLVLALEKLGNGAAPSHPWALQLRQILAMHLANPPTIGQVSKTFHLSRTAFSHAFRRRTGKTPAAFLHQLRLSEAGKLLKVGDASVKEVAAKTGFRDPAQFAKAFRRQFGISPSAYRSWFR